MAATEAPPRRRRRGLRALATLLIVAGLLVLADVAVTLAWEEPLTGAYSAWRQRGLEDRLAELERAPLPAQERRVLARVPDPRRRLALDARVLGRRTGPGDPVGRLRIPAIGLRTVVVEGTDPEELRDGPGHYPDSVLPGERGTVALAGHRTTYGAPFRRVDALERGDRIDVDTPYGSFTYRVDATRIVPATAVAVVASISSKANKNRKSNRPRLSHLPTIPPLYGMSKPGFRPKTGCITPPASASAPRSSATAHPAWLWFRPAPARWP